MSNSENHLDSHDTAMSIDDFQIASAEEEELKGLLNAKWMLSIQILYKIDVIVMIHHKYQPNDQQSSPNEKIEFHQMGNV
jgi:hypothetical protein